MYKPESIEMLTDEFSELLDLLLEEQIPAVLANKIGELCVSHGFPSTGKAFFHKALQTGVTTDEALNNLAVLSFHNGDHMQSEQYLYQSISMNPANWPARQNLADLYASVPQLAERTGDEFVYCPCCNGVFPAFIAGGPNLRPNAYCPRCGSLERHRLLWLFLREKTNFFSANLKVLHVAPEKIFQEAFKMLPNLDYVSADLASPLAMIKMDVTDIQFADNTFDVIICSHVLEHVPDDRKAMRELLRVLKPGGWAILQVPIDMNRSETFEDPGITDPAERQRLFGQDDHVRWYGRDYPERLRESGFEVNVQSFAREMSPESVQRAGIVLDEDIFFCLKTLLNAKEAPRSQNKMPGQIQALI